MQTRHTTRVYRIVRGNIMRYSPNSIDRMSGYNFKIAFPIEEHGTRYKDAAERKRDIIQILDNNNYDCDYTIRYSDYTISLRPQQIRIIIKHNESIDIDELQTYMALLFNAKLMHDGYY